MKPNFPPLKLVHVGRKTAVAVVASALYLGLFVATAAAQSTSTPVAKPAAKTAPKAAVPAAAPPATSPAAPDADKGLAKSSGSSRQPILTRDELRACFAQEESIRKLIEAMEADRNKLNQEKAVIATDQQGLQAERAPLNELRKQTEEFAARLKVYSARVDSWNQRVAVLNEDKKGGAQADKARADLNKEREDLGKDSVLLEAEKSRINSANEEAVRTFNGKAAGLDARVASWNERNAKWNETSLAAETERKVWVTACSDRRYREEDETAIKAGK